MRVDPAYTWSSFSLKGAAKSNPRRPHEQIKDWKNRLTETDNQTWSMPSSGGVLMAAPVAGAVSYTSDVLGLRGTP